MIAASSDRRRRWRWPRRIAIGSAAAVALFAVLGFFVAGPIARRVAEKQLGELLGRKVSIARIRVNPFALSLAVEGFRIFEADGTTTFVGFSRLYVNAQLSSVFRRAPIIKEVRLESPRLRVVRTQATADAWADVGSAYNFSDIVTRMAARPKAPEPPRPPPRAEPESPPRFSVNNISLSDGAVTFEDRPLGTHHEVTELAIGVPFVSTLPVYLDSFVEPGLGVRIDGTPFTIAGRTKPFKDSLETVLELRFKELDLTRYVPFVPLALPFAVESARLTLALDVAFVRPRADAPRLGVKGRVALEKLDLREKRPSGPAPLVALDKLEVTIADADVTGQRFHLGEILVSGLDVHARRGRDGTLNLEHMAPGAAPTPAGGRHERGATGHAAAAARPDPGEPKAEPRFVLDRFTLEKTELHLRDESVRPAFEANVKDVAVSVRGLSNAPGATAKVTAGLRAVPGGTVTHEGTLGLAPLAATGKVTVEGIEPGRFAPYYRDSVAFDIVSGKLRLGAGYHFEPGRAHPTVRVSDAFLEVADLALRRRGARDDFFRLGALAVRGAKLDLGARAVTVAEVSTRDARVRAARDAQGVVDLSTLVPPPPGAPAAAPAAPAPPPAAPAPAAGPAWTVTLARFDMERWGARFEDRAVKPAAVLTVDPIAVHVTNLSTAPGAKLGLDLKLGVNKTGRLQATGTTVLEPLAANVRFDLRAIEILPLQPYFRDQVNLTVTGGSVSVKGQAAVKLGAAPAAPVNATATVDIDVNDLATVDRDKQEPLLKWRSFHVGGLRVATTPLAVAIHDVGLSDFQSRLILFPDGRFNLEEALAAPPSAGAAKPAAKLARKPPATAARKAATAAAPPPPRITIGEVTLKGGQVSFSDRVIHPSYAAEISDLGGRVTGLSSVPGSTAAVDIRGALNRSGALVIVGKVNPLAKDLYLDTQIEIRDFELPPTSPYSGRYVGYGISKGKLDISLDYKIAARRLEAKNKLVLDQFTFGDKVDSPDAVKVPVRLAVALLKDRHGVIAIDVPIAGSLDDPEFKIGRAVLKVLGNLVVKAVTAPFSLIASAFGGGDELSRIDFAPGTAALDATARKRIAVLGKALAERPGISFEIQGGVDPRKDREGLRRFLYERKLKAQKLIELVQAGAAVSSPDAVEIDAAERPRLLDAAYSVEKFPKPKNAMGGERVLPPPEMEKLMLANTRVEPDDLRALALRRATAVQATLAKATPGAASRLYLITPRLGGPDGHVELKLKKD